MRNIAIQLVMLTVLICIAAFSSSAASDIDAKLAKAEELRTSDRGEFDRIITEIGRTANDATPAQLGRLALMQAYGMVLSGDLQGAIRKLKTLIASDVDADLGFRANALLVNAYALRRQFSEGLSVLEKMLPVMDRVKDQQARHQGMLAASILYNMVGQYKLGKDYAEKILAEAASNRSQCFANNLRLEALQNLGSAESDDVYFAAVRRCQAENETIAVNLVRSYLARKWHAEGRTEKALSLLEANLEEVRSTKYPHLIGEFHALIAEYRMIKGDTAIAEVNAKSVVDLSKDLTHTLHLAIAYRVLYELSEARGDLASALVLHKKFAGADKAYLNEVKARELAYQLVRQETLQQTQQIELLNRQNEVLQLQQQVQEQNAQNTRLLVLLLLLLIASIGFWAYKTKRLQMSLKRMAETDALTGICNRHHFTQQSELALAQGARAGEDVALVMFDLDHFKSINDRYGHETGDWVLKRVVAVCAPVCRQIDFFGRIGGEEFAILLIGIDARGAKRLAEDCRVRIANIDSGDSGYRFKPSASFGVTTTALSGYDLAKMLSHADKMLYRAKRGGRNRVFVYEVPVPVQLPVPVVGAHGASEPAAAPTVVEPAGDTPAAVAEDESPQRAAAVS